MTKNIGTDADIARVRVQEQGADPSAPTSGYGYFYEKTDQKPYFENASGTVFSLAGIYPQDVFIPIHQFKIISGSFTWSGTTDTNQELNTQFFQSSAADGNIIQTTVMLKSGVYDVYVLGITANNRGKIDWSLDGGTPFISGQDWYNVATQQNITKTGTLTVASSGRHRLRATVNGKNGSSSNYFVVITAVWINAQVQTTEV